MRQHGGLERAMEAYEDARIRGLCHEGALEAALGAAEGVDRQALLRELEQLMKPSKSPTAIQVKRIHEPPSRTDGVRILVDRLWPRGISKEAAQVDEWFRDLAPSAELRKWFGHDPAKWVEFQRRYHAELDAQNERIDQLLHRAAGRRLTLVYAAKDTEHNNAVALRNYLERRR